MPDCDPRDGCFCLPLTPIIDYLFFCIPFIFERIFLNNEITSTADVRRIMITLLWRLMTSLCSVT